MACIATVAKGHEFWIDPIAHQVPVGEPVEADLRVGQVFEGSAQSYIPRNFRRFDFVMGDIRLPVEGRVGDRPAFQVTPGREGLLVVVHETTDAFVTWSTWEKFVSFLTHKDLTWGLAEHDARGLARERVRERYSRYAKSLIAVGHGQGSDRAVGLEVELVALENPYTDNMTDGLDIVVYYQGDVLEDAQIEVFRKAPDDTVEVRLFRTDEAGQATIPVQPGYRYQLDTVVLRPLKVVDDGDASWETLWANLTFAVPEGE